MLIVEVKEKDNSEENTYPCLMENIHNSLIVLMTHYKCGVVVRGSNAYCVGDTATDWYMDGFKPFNGKITLSNGDL